ncbi:phosphatidylinositol-4- kinase [Coemansia sp. RSA 1813]|nr:phosphatidylinositol-4- kinase [Coemansia sp. RSA 1646]KAJ1767837.1 phosphatidylinositol-4- kinase [Coemansia sp. RSA 1843]KAJ2092108.1 phosphatidylinositol-4- kinase [Coemansia sp. RSA 986]KAJ2211039.1 phosphatidylinositol-4- kinase [Coemansia sp. RSA 487]KAJ2564286.1 phosphatidylinositol-4- kinase [Coemansia sp. RSA 1813]
MECLDLHSLILEELSEVLSITCAPQTADTVFAADPAILKILAQCPQLLERNSVGNDKPRPSSRIRVVTKRQEDAILALAKLVSQLSSPVSRQALLDRVLSYLDALPSYSYSFSSFGVDGVPGEHWFLQRFIGRLLACAASSPDLADSILEHVWGHLNQLIGILETADVERIVVFALPALLGSMEALEMSPFRYRASDVAMADALSARLLSEKVVDNIQQAIGESYTATISTRRTVSLYSQGGIVLSANHVLAQFLLVLRAILESRLAIQLVEGGVLDDELIHRKDPHQLWELMSHIDTHRCHSDGDRSGIRLPEDDGLGTAYSRILSFSLQTYGETRSSLLLSPKIAAATVSDADGCDASTASRSILATGMSIMYRSMYTSTLACMLLGRLDSGLLGSILEHIQGTHVQQLSSLTVVCFRVLVIVSAFFPSSRGEIISAVSGFITSPPNDLAQELVSSGRASRDEERLLLPAAAALHSCMRLLSVDRQSAVSAIHTLFNALSAYCISVSASAEPSQAALRVSRNVIVVLSQLALMYNDVEITSLVVGMICSPSVALSPVLHSIAIQCGARIATIAEQSVFVDIVAAALKHIRFGDATDCPSNSDMCDTLIKLAWGVAEQTGVIEEYFCMTMRSFVDSSVESPAPAKFKKGAVTPLSVFLPVLQAIVSSKGYSIDKEATAEQISLWRNFWFHMVVRGYVTEKSYTSAYGKIYSTLAAKSPILVHPSSVNYLETEIEYNSVLQREYSDSGLSHLRQSLDPIVSTQSHTLLRNISFPHAAFLLATYSVEIARAMSGNCVTVLRYFSNSAVTSSTLLPAIESIADLAISAYVREITSRKWSIEASLAGSSSRAPSEKSLPGASKFRGHSTLAQNGPVTIAKTARDASRPVVAQVRELMVASCHHLMQVSKWAQHFVDKILRSFPQALLDRTVICTLFELVQLVWKSCKAEQDDQFVPVYLFTSQSLGITLQLPDSISYRKTLFSQFSECAKRWVELAGKAAPMELETLLQIYLSTPCDDDLNYEPHVGRALALDIGSAIKYGITPSVDASSTIAALPSNSSSFTYRLSQRGYMRGHLGNGADVAALKELLSGVYSVAKDDPGAPLPEGRPSIREVMDLMHQAAQHIIATPKLDRELVRLLVWVPIAMFDESLMRAARHIWTMLIVERADVEVLIMTELTVAWTWLIQQYQGLFSQRFEPKDPFAAKMSYTPSDKSARSRGYSVISHTLNPHMQLIEFIMQRFDSVKHLPYSNFSAINAILRILQVTFDNVDRITTNSLARGPLFMLVHLGFKLLKLGFESSPILETKLRDGLYCLAFRWFALPPHWSFSGSKMSLAREIRILIDTRHTVKSDTPVLRITPSLSGRWSANVTGLGVSSLSQASNSSIGSGAVGSGAQPMTALNGGGGTSSQKQHSHHHHSHHLPHLHPSLHLRSLNPLHRHKRQSSPSKSQSGRLGTVQYSSATSATSLDETANDPDRDLILNVPREKLKERALHNRSLLLLLLESEICRMSTWANPTNQKLSYFPDVSRFARSTEISEQGWQNLVDDAWVANPSLAVQLTHRFSHPSIKRELVGLICRYPGELVNDPDALPLLIERMGAGDYAQGSVAFPVVGSGSGSTAERHDKGGSSATALVGSILSDGGSNNLSTPLSFREQKFLLYWAAVPPITSTSYLSSSVSRNPLVLQYTMRALECFPVDTTFFYIPQLVQALRYDNSGYTERAIISSAQISQHFAHQIIWNMKANMFKDDDSQVPDSLKPVLERIIDVIVGGLSGDDRTYYQKEFAFFGEVTGISGKLKPFIKKSKPEKKRKIDEEMRKIKVEPGVYLPSNPDGFVVDIDYNSGRPLQSHAKAPFMATFIISKPQSSGDEVQELLKESDRTVTPSGSLDDSEAASVLANNEASAGGNASGPPGMQADPGSDNVDAKSPNGATDADYLAAKLAKTKVETRRTLSSGLSDAPDLIGIMQHQSQPRSGRPSREYSRVSNANANATETSTPPSSSCKRRETPGGEAAEASTTAGYSEDAKTKNHASNTSDEKRVISQLSAIFKVGDDCRQDVLALQLIAVFKNIFTSCGLDLYLFPYRVVATAPGCGVIDVIPNSISRDQMGREKVNSLSDYFATKYHGVDSIQYQQARSNFVQSLAAYSVLSYLLQFKDRHNGNIMLDDQGHIVHIDFGFILDIAPGGITFESAPFKLTTEYIQVMGGSADAQPYKLFCELCIKAFLASRPYAEKIVQIVSLMLESGLPCFKGETTLAKLRGRFQLDKSEREAAQFMMDRINDSYENKRTVLYDQFQKATNGIPY